MSIYDEIINDPLASESQKAAAQKMIDAAKPKTAEPVTGPVLLPAGPVHTRGDKTTYQSGSVMVSAEYAKELLKKFGRLGPEAGEYAAGYRLQSAVGSVMGGTTGGTTETDIKFLEQLPDSQSFWDDCRVKLKAFHASMDAAFRLSSSRQFETREKQQLPIEPAPVPTGVQVDQPAPVMSPVDRAIALKNLLGRV